MATFADRLKELRKQTNLTQVEVAKAVGCTEQHYQRLEYGKVIPNAVLLAKLADHFNVSTDYLLGRTNYWIDSDGNIKVKTPPDILNLNTDELKKHLGKRQSK